MNWVPRLQRLVIVPFLAGVGFFTLIKMLPRVHASTIQVANTLQLDEDGVGLGTNSARTAHLAWGDVDNDGDLDLALGDEFGAFVYTNSAGSLTESPAWSISTGAVSAVAWGDIDNDGDLDLAAGTRLYLNHNGILSTTHSWQPLAGGASGLAWGDVDGDGDLDLVAGSAASNRLYLNNDGVLDVIALWTSAELGTRRIALGDVDGDGDLDLATANYREPNALFLNNGGTFSADPDWVSAESDETFDLAWGDMDNDGDLDLAVANWGVNRIYENENGALENSAGWISTNADNSSGIAWGDANGDGYLDLAVGNSPVAANNQVHLNYGGVLENNASWTSTDEEFTTAIAWGDVDGDGILDLAAVNNQVNRLYPNATLALPATINNVGPSALRAAKLAFGDVDGDGDLDVAYTGSSATGLLRNDDGILSNNSIWTLFGISDAAAIAWADVDGDGNLDLAVGDEYAYVFFNMGGMLATQAGWRSAELTNPSSLAWADVDGDGDLDLAVGSRSQPDRLYLNKNGSLATTPVWVSATSNDTLAVAWGDVDSDGDLDLAIGTDFGETNKLYRNTDGVLAADTAWESAEMDITYSIAWGDVDGDGAVDLAAGNGDNVNRVYKNVSAALEQTASWVSAESEDTRCVAWGDLDNDGDLDLASGNHGVVGEANRFYLNDGGALRSVAALSSINADETGCVAWGDVNGDGLPDLLVANEDQPLRLHLNQPLGIVQNSATDRARVALQSEDAATFGGNSADFASANFYAMPAIREGIIPLPYVLFESNEQASGRVQFQFSLDGGDNWRHAMPTTDTQTAGLAQLPFPTATVTNTHTFYWDTFASGLFGQSDNVVVRLLVFPNYSPTNGTPFPIQRPHVAAYSYPFRVRGTQVRVLTEDGAAARAIVYQQSAGASQFTLLGTGQTRFETNHTGYLQGGGELRLGDRLVALRPVEQTDDYTLYHTSASATLTGVTSYEMRAAGVQTLTVSAENPLLVFNLDLSLEWDARNNPTYLDRLASELQATSRILYDVSNGQVALGQVNIYQARQAWHTSDVRIFASNTIRPNADVGGIVSMPMTETIRSGEVITQAYFPGQVRMPATWNRFGTPSGNPGEDWARAFAHELSHYLLFQLDNYLGVSAAGNLAITDCVGSVMTRAYAVSYSEFIGADQWLGECLDTLAEHTTDRTDWETVQAFYPALHIDRRNDGPVNLPLNLLDVQIVDLPTPPNTLVNAFIEVRDESGAPLGTSSAQVQVYAYKTHGTPDPLDDAVLSLGSPVVGNILARGVEIGDRLCVYDSSTNGQRTGCIEQIDAASDSVQLQLLGDWNPQISVIPPMSNSLIISVTQPGATGIVVQLYPSTLFTETLVPTAVTYTLDAAIGQTGVFTKKVLLDDPTFSGFLRVWEPSSGRETLTNYYFGGGWGPSFYGWGPSFYGWGSAYKGWGPSFYGWGTNRIGWGIGRTGWNAPVHSANGQVTVFDMDNVLGLTPPYILQGLVEVPDLPLWLAPVGQTYRFISPIPFTGTYSILFQYLQRDVPDATLEGALQIYHKAPSSEAWQPLPTEVDSNQNLAATTMPDEGVYMLASTFKAAELASGWNNVAYPVLTSRPVVDALASIHGSYQVVYQQRTDSTWMLHDQSIKPPFAALVNSLETMQLGAYWIYATAPVTWYVPNDVGSVQEAAQITAPPMTMYGWVTPTSYLNVQAGDPISATINGITCGTAVIQTVADGLGYVLQVTAESLVGVANGCGQVGQQVALEIDGLTVVDEVAWNNHVAHYESVEAKPVVRVGLSNFMVKGSERGVTILLLALGLLILTNWQWRRQAR